MERVRFFDGEQWRLLKQRSVEALIGDRAFLTRYASFCLFVVMLVMFMTVMISVYETLDGFFGRASEERFDVVPRMLLVFVFGVFWMGASAGAGALIRERAMFVRECEVARLNVAAYLGGKLHSLSLLGILTVAGYLLIASTARGEGIDEVMRAPVGWAMIVLLATVVCGISLGLMISALSRSVRWSQGVVAVFVLGMMLLAGGDGKAYSRVEMILQGLSPLSWSRASLIEYGSPMPNELFATSQLLPVMWFSVVFLAVAYVFLKRQGYGDLRE